MTRNKFFLVFRFKAKEDAMVSLVILSRHLAGWLERKPIKKTKMMFAPCVTCDAEAISFFSVAGRLFPQQQKKTPRCTVRCCLWCVFDPQKKNTLSIHATRFLKKKETRHHSNLKKCERALRVFERKPHHLNPPSSVLVFSIKLCISVKDNLKKMDWP